MSRYHTHKALGECWRSRRSAGAGASGGFATEAGGEAPEPANVTSWHWPARDCKTTACGSTRPNRVTHDWAMVSCKTCLGLRPRTTPLLAVPKRVRKKKGAASATVAAPVEVPKGQLTMDVVMEPPLRFDGHGNFDDKEGKT